MMGIVLAMDILEKDIQFLPTEESITFLISSSSFGPPARKNLHLYFALSFSNNLIKLFISQRFVGPEAEMPQTIFLVLLDML